MHATPSAPRRRTLIAVTIGATLAALIGACGDAAGPGGAADGARLAATSPPPATTPDIRGIVTAITAGDSVRPPSTSGPSDGSVSCPPSCAPTGRPLRALHIEEIPGDPASGGARGAKSIVTVLGGVPVLRRAGDAATVAAFDSLRVGQRVSAWFDGPVLESYPSQARARALVIEPR